jgi:hypothetical protein
MRRRSASAASTPRARLDDSRSASIASASARVGPSMPRANLPCTDPSHRVPSAANGSNASPISETGNADANELIVQKSPTITANGAVPIQNGTAMNAAATDHMTTTETNSRMPTGNSNSR